MRSLGLSLFVAAVSLGLLALIPGAVQAQRVRPVMPVHPVTPVASGHSRQPVLQINIRHLGKDLRHLRLGSEFFVHPGMMTGYSPYGNSYPMTGGYPDMSGGYGSSSGYPPSSGTNQVPSGPEIRSSFAPTDAGRVVEVDVTDGSFQPRAVTVSAGTTVRWTNRGSSRHTVTSAAGLWDSGELAPGGVYSYTFTQRGSDFFFQSADNPRVLQGVVTVQ